MSSANPACGVRLTRGGAIRAAGPRPGAIATVTDLSWHARFSADAVRLRPPRSVCRDLRLEAAG
jgi:hypothetical protein